MSEQIKRDPAKPLRVGLTGGIASGKSTVAEMFAALGVVVIDTDVIARNVVMPGEQGLEAIRERFGDSVLQDDGTLDRRRMRELIFADEASRRDLEAILHPLIRDETLREAKAATGPYLLIVVPLLTQSSLKDHVDRILVVDCSEETQLERLTRRDAETRAQAKRMLAAQASRDERLAIADDIVHNDGDIDSTRTQVSALHDLYCEL